MHARMRDNVVRSNQGDKSTLKQIQMMYKHDEYFNELFHKDFERIAECCLGGKVEGKNLQYFNKVPKVGNFLIKSMYVLICFPI